MKLIAENQICPLRHERIRLALPEKEKYPEICKSNNFMIYMKFYVTIPILCEFYVTD